jgi:cytoskeletal protein CcmA (bactofilin family)
VETGLKSIRRRIEIGIGLAALLVMLAAGVAWATARPAAAQGGPERVAVNQDMVIEKGDTVGGDVSVTNGNLTIYGTVDGRVSIVNGEAEIYGNVLGDVVVLPGKGVTLYDGASVGGNILASEDINLNGKSVVAGSVTSIGGKVNRESGAVVKGSVSTMDNPAQALQNIVQPVQPQPGQPEGSFDSSPFARITGLFSIGILSLLILLLSVGMAAAIPNRVRTASATLQSEPGPAIVVGIITAFLIFPVAGIVAVILTVSVVGALLLPVLAIALLGAFLLGFVVVGHWLGRHLHETTRQGAEPLSFQSPTLIIEVLLGVAVLLASTLIPVLFLPSWIAVLMFLLVYSIACLGIGATVLSRFGTLAPPKQRHPHRVLYPTPVHSHYGSALPHQSPVQMMATASASSEPTNTRPLGPTPALPREE